MVASTELDLTQVDGVKVVQRESARYATGESGDTRPGGILKDVDEVLLEDSRVVYQCVARTGGCGKTWDNPRSVTAHLKQHQGIQAQNRLQQEVEEVRAENDRLRKQARENDRRRQRRDAEKTTAGPVLDDQTRQRRDTYLRLVDDGVGLIEKGRELVCEGVDGLAGLALPVDPAVAEKAAKYDQLRGLIG